MNRGTVKSVAIIALAAVVLLFATNLLFGDDGDSKNYSHPITPDVPDPEMKTENWIPFKAKEHSFSEQFMPSPRKDLKMHIHSIIDGRKLKSPILQYSPKETTYYHIAELMVRKDIDYKIRKLGR